MKKVILIVLGVLGLLIVLFFIINRIYRMNTIDKGLSEMIDKGAIILDVRTQREYKTGHIKGALNISLGTIRERYTELDTNKTYITYCSHGIRSMEVKNILKKKGFKKVFNGGALSDLERIIKKHNTQ